MKSWLKNRTSINFLKLKISFTKMFDESLKKQFSWNLMLRYTVKLTLNYYFMK